MHDGQAFQTLWLSFTRKETFHPKRDYLTEVTITQETPKGEKKSKSDNTLMFRQRRRRWTIVSSLSWHREQQLVRVNLFFKADHKLKSFYRKPPKQRNTSFNSSKCTSKEKEVRVLCFIALDIDLTENTPFLVLVPRNKSSTPSITLVSPIRHNNLPTSSSPNYWKILSNIPYQAPNSAKSPHPRLLCARVNKEGKQYSKIYLHTVCPCKTLSSSCPIPQKRIRLLSLLPQTFQKPTTYPSLGIQENHPPPRHIYL